MSNFELFKKQSTFVVQSPAVCQAVLFEIYGSVQSAALFL